MAKNTGSKDLKKCKHDGCRRPAAKNRGACWPCITAAYKAAHPIEYAYKNLRSNARRRKKQFDLTLEQFREFCYKTQILHGRGRTATSYHIDRIRDHEGYNKDNIQVLTCTENVQKENARRKIVAYDWITGEARVIDRTPKEPDPECPF